MNSEISLFKKYMKKISFSNLLSEKISINPCNCIYYISLNRPGNKLLCGIYYMYETVRVI